MTPKQISFKKLPLGRLKVSVKTLPGLYPEVVLYRRGDWMCLGGGANQLIEATLTDMGSGAAADAKKMTKSG